MNNVLYEPLPEEWHGYKINSWFQIGVQIYIASEDKALMKFEKNAVIASLLFTDEVPPYDEMQECIDWFLNGWCHDRSPQGRERRKLLDFNIDQWRIYADFRQIYGINLNDADLHWWEFMGMLWNMPERQSSFLQVIKIRRKKITAKMSKEEKNAIRNAQYVYGLEDNVEKRNHEYTEEEMRRINEVDRIRAQMKAKRRERERGVAEAVANMMEKSE